MGWIMFVPGNDLKKKKKKKAYCRYCKSEMRALHGELVSHAKTKKLNK